MSSTLLVQIDTPDRGWLDLTLKTDKDEVFITTSVEYDPYPDMLAWLEAIADGHALNMVIDDESDDYHFQVHHQSQNPDWIHFSIKSPYQTPPVLLDIKIRRLDLVNEFYTALQHQVSSDEFDIQWLEFGDLEGKTKADYRSEKIEQYLIHA